MKKNFGDIKVGDYVWIIDGYEISKVEVTKIQKSLTLKDVCYISLSFLNNPYPYHICRLNLKQKRNGNLFLIKEEAIECLKKRSRKRIAILETKINAIISEFNALDSLTSPTVKPSTKSPSMKELKPGDSVWYIDKVELKIVEKKVKSKREVFIRLKTYLEVFINSYESFYTFPRSYRSVRLLYYTTEEQAWRYMLKWKKSRMRTVGKEMEKLMKELEKYEEVW